MRGTQNAVVAVLGAATAGKAESAVTVLFAGTTEGRADSAVLVLLAGSAVVQGQPGWLTRDLFEVLGGVVVVWEQPGWLTRDLFLFLFFSCSPWCWTARASPTTTPLSSLVSSACWW